MRKISLIFYCITLTLICQPLLAASALSDRQTAAIADHCTAIKDDLKKVQKDDSRARVYLGGYYETIISKFVTPLNVWLVENSLSTAELIENQNQLSSNKTTFSNDFIDYQRELDTLVGLDCSAEPDNFYTQLEKVRKKRATVSSDVAKINSLISDHTRTIQNLKDTL